MLTDNQPRKKNKNVKNEIQYYSFYARSQQYFSENAYSAFINKKKLNSYGEIN